MLYVQQRTFVRHVQYMYINVNATLPIRSIVNNKQVFGIYVNKIYWEYILSYMSFGTF